jgi:hypothetical protein
MLHPAPKVMAIASNRIKHRAVDLSLRRFRRRLLGELATCLTRRPHACSERCAELQKTDKVDLPEPQS